MSSVNAWAVAALSLGLAACATTLYQPQAGEPTARLRLVTAPTPRYHGDGGRASTLWVDDLSACPQRPRRVLAASPLSSEEARLGMPVPPDPARVSAEFVIPAGKPLGITVLGGRGLQYCEVALRLVPLAGQDYEIESRWHDAQRQCVLGLVRLAPGANGALQRVPVSRTEAAQIDTARLCEPPKSR